MMVTRRVSGIALTRDKRDELEVTLSVCILFVNLGVLSSTWSVTVSLTERLFLRRTRFPYSSSHLKLLFSRCRIAKSRLRRTASRYPDCRQRRSGITMVRDQISLRMILLTMVHSLYLIYTFLPVGARILPSLFPATPMTVLPDVVITRALPDPNKKDDISFRRAYEIIDKLQTDTTIFQPRAVFDGKANLFATRELFQGGKSVEFVACNLLSYELIPT